MTDALDAAMDPSLPADHEAPSGPPPRTFGSGFETRVAVAIDGQVPSTVDQLLPYAGPLLSATVVRGDDGTGGSWWARCRSTCSRPTPNAAVTPAIAARGLTKRYGDTAAVDAIDLTVERGELFGFLGPNGAGKTTTIRMALGLILPTGGEVDLLGETVRTDHAPLERVGALVEEPAFWKYLSGRKNLEYFARAGGTRADVRARLGRVDEVLETVGLTDAAGKRVKAYSQGMRQRLGIGLALLGAPGAAGARRAHERSRSERHAGDAVAPASAGRRRHHDLRLESPARRGRGDVRPGRRDGPRAPGGARAAREPCEAPPTACGSRSTMSRPPQRSSVRSTACR